MNRLYLTAILAMFVLHVGTATAVTLQKKGDILTALMPIVAFGTAYFKDDSLGETQWLHATLLNEVLNTSLVLAFNNTSLGTRPNGHPYSFPSGHAAFAFTQAGFLLERYGWWYGAPAMLAASTVAYIRVDVGKHHWRDVIAGGAIGYSVAWLTVTPEKATHLAPIIGPDWIGIRYERSF